MANPNLGVPDDAPDMSGLDGAPKKTWPEFGRHVVKKFTTKSVV
jgi:hypothetical protein